MKLQERITWYSRPENRYWKRIWHLTELIIYSATLIICSVTLFWYGDGTSFQLPYIILSVGLAISCALSAVGIYKNETIKRWHIQIISFGFLSSAGLCAMAGFLILSVQGTAT